MAELNRRGRLLAKFPMDLDARQNSTLHSRIEAQVSYYPFKRCFALRSQIDDRVYSPIFNAIHEVMPR